MIVLEQNATSQQKIALLSCQLKKSEAEKRTYEVATEKLLKFAEVTHSVLTCSMSCSVFEMQEDKNLFRHVHVCTVTFF